MKKDKEIWVDSYSDPHLYSVSNMGRVKNKKRNTFLSVNQQRGYNLVSLRKKQRRLARLVYFSFNPKTPKYLHIHHKDHNRSNDRLNNLEPIDQKLHTSMHNKIRGTKPPSLSGKNNPRWKGRIIAINLVTKKIDYIMSSPSEMKSCGFLPAAIYSVICGTKNTHRNYFFKRINNDFHVNVGDNYEYIPKPKKMAKHVRYLSQIIIAVEPNSNKINHIFSTKKSMKDAGFDPSTVYSILRNNKYKHKKLIFKRISNDLKVEIGQIFDINKECLK
jgi:hypothetical protein